MSTEAFPDPLMPVMMTNSPCGRVSEAILLEFLRVDRLDFWLGFCGAIAKDVSRDSYHPLVKERVQAALKCERVRSTNARATERAP